MKKHKHWLKSFSKEEIIIKKNQTSSAVIKSASMRRLEDENFWNQKMSSEDTLFSGMMQTSVTSESSTLSGLATGPIPGSALGTGGTSGGLAFDTDASYAVMNDKVQALAGSIYEELERMITKYDQVGFILLQITCVRLILYDKVLLKTHLYLFIFQQSISIFFVLLKLHNLVTGFPNKRSIHEMLLFKLLNFYNDLDFGSSNAYRNIC